MVSQVECNKGKTQGQDRAGRRRTEGAAGDAREGGWAEQVRCARGRGTVRGWGNTGSECGKERRTAEGRKGQRKAGEVKGVKGRSEGRGTVDAVRTVSGRGAESGRGRGREQGGGEHKGQGKAALQGVGGKEEGELGEGGFMGAPVYRGKRGGSRGGECHPTGTARSVPDCTASVAPPQRCTWVRCRQHPRCSTPRRSGWRGGCQEGRGRNSGKRGRG